VQVLQADPRIGMSWIMTVHVKEAD
jgi:hypothetical protein